MRRVLALAWLNMLQLLRNPAELAAVIILPLLLTVIFGSAFANVAGKPTRLPFVDEDGTRYSKQVRELLAAEPSFALEDVSRADAEQLVSTGDVSVAIIVPEGFGDGIAAGSAAIETLANPASESAFAVVAVVRGVAVRMSGDVAAARAVAPLKPGADFGSLYDAADARWEPDPPIAVKGQTVIASEVRGESVQASGVTQSSAGFAVFFLMFVTFGGAGGIIEEREQGTLRRLLITPSSRTVLILGKIVGIVATAVAQVLVLTTVGALVFGVPWFAHPGAVALVLFAYILAVTGLAVLVSTVVRSRDQFSGLSPIFSTGFAMLGGSFWSLDIVSPAMRTIGLLTPTGWAMTGLTDVLARNMGIDAVLVPSAVLFGFALVTLGLGIKMLKFE